jgi:hypothetical protein
MAGGQKINDHKFWAGGASKGSPFPDGAKVKTESSAEGAGELNMYEDTTEAIRGVQSSQEKKMNTHKQKPGYRN